VTVTRPSEINSSIATDQEFGRFFLPGPTEVLPEILDAQRRPMIGHRGPAIEELLAGVQPELKRIFRTARPVYISSSSATGMMEAAVRNAARGRVLSLVNGAFSERFHRIVQGCGLAADALEVPWGAVHAPELVAEALRRQAYDTVTVVHSETSTGAMNPIADLARLVHQSGDVMLLVDSVTGIAGAPVETDGWEVDFILTGSQKALALPPGLAFAVAQERVLARAKEAKSRGIYFDLLEFEHYVTLHQTPNTPAVSLLYALEVQLGRIARETIEARWARHAAMAERMAEWVREMDERGIALGILAPEGHRSPTVTCVTLPKGVGTGRQIAAAMEERGFTIASGYGKLRDSTIRIGHMGDHTVAELDTLLDVLTSVLVR
jgi:aspartate aminotransferase-like enzyme